MKNFFAIVIISLVVILVAIFPLFSRASLVDELQGKIQDRNQKLEQLEKEIKEYQTQIEETGKQSQTLSNTIKTLDISEKKLKTDIEVTLNRLDATALTIEEIDLEIGKKEDSIGGNTKAIAEILRQINEAESTSLIETVLVHNSFNYLWEEIESLQRFQISIRQKVDDLKDVKAALERKQSELEQKKKDLANYQSSLSDQKRIVKINRQEKQSLLAETKNKEANYKQILEEKQQRKEEFEQELFKFESELSFELDKSRIPSAREGVLAWPLDNVFITQKFGKTVDSVRLYSSGTHNGIDLRASRGTPLKSAADGTVLGVGNTDLQPGCYSYGQWVLIAHDNGLSTLYAHLDLIKVSVGQLVRRGDLIGYSGATGYATGPHLHFTVYASEGVKIARNSQSKYCKEVDIPLAGSNAYLNPEDYL